MSKPTTPVNKPNPAPAAIIDNTTGEVVPAVQQFGGGSVVKVIKHVSVPVLPFLDGMTINCRIVDAIRQGKEIAQQRGGEVKMAPAMLMTIADASGNLRTLIVGKVMESELKESYPKDSYVGKWFSFTRVAPNKEKGKRYATFGIAEIEPLA